MEESSKSGQLPGQAHGSHEVVDGDEEQDDTSSSSSSASPDEEKTMENVLLTFRSQWHKEIKNDATDRPSKNSDGRGNQNSAENLDNIEHLAKELFQKGVEHEQKGLFYESIQFYRKAVQLVPDIEFKMYDSLRKDRSEVIARREEEQVDVDAEGNQDEDHVGDEQVTLQNWLSSARGLCTPAVEQRTTHISSLPVEILLLIFRWVVSADLDIRSLDMCSLVCRGFYCCARDPEIWRTICLRLWGAHCETLKSSSLSWHDIYMQNPHLHFSGCYVSKTTYVRHGENSFQDQFYRPWHLVEYYRYLRFFPEGRVLMMTTAEKPGPMVAHLRDRQSKYPAIIVGHYRLMGDIVALVLTRRDQEKKNNRYRGRNNRANVETSEQTYNIELLLKPWKSHRNGQLSWMQYRVFTRRGATETVTNFEVYNSKFAPFWFSRVKSYTGESELPLS